MKHAAINRRTVLAGLAATAAPLLAGAADSPLAHGVLANNRLAQAFKPAPQSRLPDVPLVGLHGEFSIDTLKGRTILMPLWAEWCAPCLSEIPDFARLHKKFSNAKFIIVPVLTSTMKQFTPSDIGRVFTVLHAEALPPVMEKNLGSRLARTMGRQGDSYALPCNLLIGPDGTVIGREIGRISAADASDGPVPQKSPDPETVTRAINGQAQSEWGKADGEEFARAMADGFLG
jgi:thiol-disulfide isomerase/thioredoxin